MSKGRVVNLTVHRNTARRRKRKEAQQELIAQVRRFATSSDCRAYALVVFDDNCEARAIWDTGRIVPEYAFAGMVRQALSIDVQNERVDREDDYLPPEDRED